MCSSDTLSTTNLTWSAMERNCVLSVTISYAAHTLFEYWIFSSILYKNVMDVLCYSIKLLLSCYTLMRCAAVPHAVTFHSQIEAHCLSQTQKFINHYFVPRYVTCRVSTDGHHRYQFCKGICCLQLGHF